MLRISVISGIAYSWMPTNSSFQVFSVNTLERRRNYVKLTKTADFPWKRIIANSCRGGAANRSEATLKANVPLFIGRCLFLSSILTSPDDFIRKSYFNFYKSHQEFFIIIHLHTHTREEKISLKLQRFFKHDFWPSNPRYADRNHHNSRDRHCTEMIAMTFHRSSPNFT